MRRQFAVMAASNSEALDSAIISGDETKKKAQSGDELNKCSTNIFTLWILLVVSAVLKILSIFPPSE